MNRRERRTTIDADMFREAMARWATGVTVVACRNDARVVATTVSAVLSLSLGPPRVLLALGPNATVRPFLTNGTRFGVSILAHDQRRIASMFADPFPVGPDPFPAEGDPVIPDALVGLTCTVAEVRAGGDHAVVIADVHAAAIRPADPLIRFERGYRRLG